jgi:hypothetical protein
MENEKCVFSEIEIEARKIIKEKTKGFLKDKVFNTKDCDFLIQKLTELILNELNSYSSNFKYILAIAMLQNDKSGLCSDHSLYFDPETDGCISEKFSYPKICCIITLYCLAI